MTAPGTTPTPGMSQWGPLADFGKRAVATLIDGVALLAAYVVIAVVTAIVGVVSDTLAGIVGLLLYLAAAAYAFYILYMTGERGASPGKRLTGLKVVKLADGQVLGGGMGIVRGLAHVVDQIICYIGYLFPLWDPMRQTIADKIVGTVVLSDQPKEPFSPAIFKL
jgi:uncharacterized RDD family membrane protein YckC